MRNLEESVTITVERRKEICQVIIQTPGYEIYIGDRYGEIGEFVGHTPTTFYVEPEEERGGLWFRKYITVKKDGEVVKGALGTSFIMERCPSELWSIFMIAPPSGGIFILNESTPTSITFDIKEWVYGWIDYAGEADLIYCYIDGELMGTIHSGGLTIYLAPGTYFVEQEAAGVRCYSDHVLYNGELYHTSEVFVKAGEESVVDIDMYNSPLDPPPQYVLDATIRHLQELGWEGLPLEWSCDIVNRKSTLTQEWCYTNKVPEVCDYESATHYWLASNPGFVFPETEICEVNIKTPGYCIEVATQPGLTTPRYNTPMVFNCASIPISEGVYECTKYITLLKPTEGVVHTCNDAKIVFRKVVPNDWCIDKGKSSSCIEAFDIISTSPTSISIAIKEEEAPGSCVYVMTDATPRPAFQLEDAQLTYNGHVALPGSTAAIDAGTEVTAKAYIRNADPTLSMAFKAMLMLTRVLAGNEYVYRRSGTYACYEDQWVYFDVKFLMPTEDTEVRLRAYYTNAKECYQDISNSFYLKATEHEEGDEEVAYITCTTVPSDAMVYLDGVDIGRQTPTTVTTTAGEHYILYRKSPNYINYETTVIAIADSTITVAADLEEGTTAREYWTDIKDITIPVEVAIESTCTHPWCLENMEKWIKVEVGLDYPFIHEGTPFCILLDLSAGNPLPEYIYCPFRSVRFETEGPSSYAIPKATATESINTLLGEQGGTVSVSQSDIPNTLYQGTPSIFNLLIVNTSAVSTEYKVSVIFEGIDIVHEERFESEWSEAIAPTETVILPVTVELSEQAIAAGQESTVYTIYTRLEAI